MKKALKIENGFFINMDSIVSFHINSDSIQIRTSVDVDDNGHYIAVKKPEMLSLFSFYEVPIQEMKRIERELKAYMGIGE